jgi:hypothetical protein
MAKAKKFTVAVYFYGSVRFDTQIEVEARDEDEACNKALSIAEATGGDDTATVKWEENFVGGDADYYAEPVQ